MPETRHTFVQMTDGVRIHATLILPDGDGGPWPAIMEILPYRKDDLTASYRPDYVRLAEHGYAVCRADVRGTGTSEGVSTDEYTREERSDLVTLIEWLATQDWSTGSVGMYGTSYSGFNSIHAAMERPPALKAIIPIFATDDRYADDVHYFGGALKALDLVDYPSYMVAMNALPPVPAHFGEGWRDEWERRVAANEPWVIPWLEHQRYDDYWKYGSLIEDYGSIEAATMIIAGWADGYTNNSLRTLQQLRCPARLIIGPWAHQATDTSRPGPNVDIVPEQLRWWDRWLKGVDNGVDREPPIVMFARRSTRPEPDLATMNGEWRYEPAWPAERLVERPFELAKAHGPGAPETNGADTLEVARGDVGWTAWISCAGYLPWGQPQDQRPDEIWSLVYDWAPLEDDLDILGHPVLEVTVTSSVPVAYLSAKLCDVFPDGTSALVTRGMLNLAHRDSREDPAPLEPGVPTRVRVPLEVTSWTFDAGNRIRLDLAGSDWPNAWSPPQAHTITIDRASAVLALPVMNGPSPVAERPTLTPPNVHPLHAEPPGDTPDGVLIWRVEHDILGRETRAVTETSGWTGAEGEFPRRYERYAGVTAVSTTDPGAGRAEGFAKLSIEWPEATVTTTARNTVRSDRDAYHLDLHLRVEEDGEERWSRRWTRTFPRDHQ
jgi:putative CocE/NonD family hydrolase